MGWKDIFRPDSFYNFFFMKKWYGLLGDGDALVLVPYSDGALIPKRGYYEKHLVGNLPGYHTEDGDIYVSEGWGNPTVNLLGVPCVLALNPSEHAAVVDPLKSLLAHKRHLGEFVRVDKNGVVVETGEAVASRTEAEALAQADGPETASAATDGGAVPTAGRSPASINYEVYDGLFDVTPPMIKDSETGDIIDQADGWIVSQAKAADLVPSKTSSAEIKLMQQRERNAMADAAEFLKYILIGFVGASVIWLIFLIIMMAASGNMPSVV